MLPTLTYEQKLRFFSYIGYTPHEHQANFHGSPARFRVIAAGARAGKSMAAGAEIVLWLMFPDTRIWVCGPQYELAEKEFDWALEFMSEIIVPGRKKKLIDLCKVSSASRGSRQIVTPWRAFARTKSTEKQSMLLGEELDVLVLSEASQIRREPYERMLRARIGPRNGKVLAISTPNSDSGLFVDLYENGRDPEKEDWESWQFRTLDNPTFSAEEWETAKRELDEKVFAEQYEGKFVSRFGKVFDVNDASIIDELPQGYEEFPVIYGVKPTQTNKFVVVKILFNRRNRSYIVADCFYKEKSNCAEAAIWISETSQGQKYVGTVSGGEDEYYQHEFRKYNVSVYSPDESGMSKEQKAIKRVQCIQSLLKNVPERPTRLFFLRSTTQPIIDEFKEATWQGSRKERNRLDPELPHDLHMNAPYAVVNPLVYFENAQGVDIYGGQQ